MKAQIHVHKLFHRLKSIIFIKFNENFPSFFLSFLPLLWVRRWWILQNINCDNDLLVYIIYWLLKAALDAIHHFFSLFNVNRVEILQEILNFLNVCNYDDCQLRSHRRILMANDFKIFYKWIKAHCSCVQRTKKWVFNI